MLAKPREFMTHAPVLAITIVLAVGALSGSAGSISATEPAPEPFVIRLVANGQPVLHAFVCNEHEQWEDSSRNLATESWDIGHLRRPRPALSDDNGVVVLPFNEVFRGSDEEMPIYALDPSTGRAAMGKLSHHSSDRQLTLVMQPCCEVSGTVQCPRLSDRGVPFKHNVFVNWEGMQLVLTDIATDGKFEFLIPPGKYTLRVGGNGQGAGPTEMYGSLIPFGGIPLDDRTLDLSIQAGEKHAAVGPLVLKPSPLGQLVGSAAPELQEIVGWRNSEPLRLSDSHGKVVVIDFWGYWCEACISSMPWLMDLHDKYKDHGLVVIGVHDPQAKSIAEMDEKIRAIRSRSWNERDIPFPVALDSGGKLGPHALYHVESWPTTVIINRDGKIVYAGDFAPEPVVRELLGLPIQ